ncbi:short-chain dehydrogenase, putative [Talaromyces stipitatus ATCC 10500]|uniref:Short-chain dehydrogenase, putative n=1 Tax=Talaromyces stipitatus (strain ATCC 10500 / CBS 375.48 / QM 6759 / NRRL 1006) TaxID=441959 RepID=B8MJ07_TALSN|nr:short-chain dehydrogenase, putative [Talaromyces stipitatus ATCC 10500]EED15669.1 short-chain dehydrogenase, putative [Talaromyces stipitatus ATCC 10500]
MHQNYAIIRNEKSNSSVLTFSTAAMAVNSTPSQTNAADLSNFVSVQHSDVYPAIDPRSNKLLQPFTAVILGASGAVGSGLVRSYAQAGATGLVLAARRLDVVGSVAYEAKTINPTLQTLVLKCDVSLASDIAAVADATRAQFGATVGAVVVNAGYSGPIVSDIAQERIEDFQNAFNINTLSAAYAAQSFIPILNESAASTSFKGAFITISSMSAPTVIGPVAHVHYCASKFAQTRVIEMLYEQQQVANGGEDGIFFASVHPGGIKSDFAKQARVPQSMLPFLTESPDLAGAFIVWLTRNQDRIRGLSGRFLSAKWDVDELLAKMDEIVDRDLLRARFAV